MSSFEKFNKILPSKDGLYNSLSGEGISDKKYPLSTYFDLYLKCDVSSLAGVFEKFRNYCLCSSHYLSAPAFSWDAIFNMTKVELDLI